MIDLNATQAAIRAGYSAKTADVIGYENLKKPQIAEALAVAQEERSERTEITADYVLTTIQETVKVLVADQDKNAANIFKGCELLGKHLKLFTDKQEITGGDGGPLEISILPVRPAHENSDSAT